MSERDAVGRLARVLCEVFGTTWDLLSEPIRKQYREAATRALRLGVTLPAPPRVVTPLEVAVRKWREAQAIGWVPDKEAMRESLAAAVGALGTYDIRDALAGALGDVPGAYYAENFRAALLAALTRNGEEAC